MHETDTDSQSAEREDVCVGENIFKRDLYKAEQGRDKAHAYPL